MHHERLRRRRRTRIAEPVALALVGSCWAVAFVVGALSAVPGVAIIGPVLAFAVVFTLGECWYSPSFQPMLMRVVPSSDLGRASGIAAAFWSTATFVAPPLGVLLVDLAPRMTLWLVCAASGLVATGCDAWLRRVGEVPERVVGHGPRPSSVTLYRR
ncbi:MAG: MFS transporter [Nocardioides sp.]|uniref:MFS transporter n=1 Tax=Nocardioides sp. TaxID=35761 RepID=UPI0039E32F30